MAVNKILVAHDLSEAANRALSYASEFARQTGAKLAVVYVLGDGSDGHDPARAAPSSPFGPSERYAQLLEEELRSAVERLTGRTSSELDLFIERGDPVLRLEQLANELGADLVCVGATGAGAAERALLGGVSQLVLRSSIIPVLIVP